MLKNNKYKGIKIAVISSLITILVSGIGTVTALTLYADDIIYNPSNTNFKVSDAKGALDKLYESISQKGGGNAVVFTSSPVDMKQYTDRWAELTNADFKVGATSAGSSASAKNGNTGTCSTNYTIGYSYNAATGQLTFSASGTGYSNAGDSGKVENRLSVGGIFAVWLGTIGGE